MKQIAIQIETSRAYGRALVEGISAFAQERGDWKLRLLPKDSELPEALNGFDGIILRLADHDTKAQLLSHRIPAVDVYGDCPAAGSGAGARRRIPVSDGNHGKTGEMAAEFFLQRGFRNFGYCGIDGLSFSDRRGDGFCQTIERTGNPVFRYVRPKRLMADSSLFYDERLDRIPDARELAKWLTSLPKPAAVFCCHDYRAYQLMLVASEQRIRIPQEIAILGVDNDTTLCAFAPVPLSSIDPNAFRVGHSAARMLESIMSNPPRKTGHAPVLTPPRGIVERESTEFLPEHPQWISDVLMFIEKNFFRGISAADVIAFSGKSSTYVEQMFRKELGQTVLERITAVRIDEAKRLLEKSDLQIKAIASRCGYSSPQYFCRTFLACVGTTPNAYRHRT